MIQYLFPISIYFGKNTDLLSDALKLYSKCENAFILSNNKVKTTLHQYFPKKANVTVDVCKFEEGIKLKNFFEYSVKEYLKEKKLGSYEVEICNIWLNILEKDSIGSVHSHYGYSFSGVYYVDCPGNSGKIFFENPLENTFYQDFSDIKEYTIENSKEWYFETTSGLIVIFPSHLKHHVPKMTCEGQRKSIAFDCVVYK